MIKEYIKQGKKYYMFQIYLGIDQNTGKKKRTTRRGFKTRKEAEIERGRLLSEIDLKGAVSNNNITFKELFDMWYIGYKDTIKKSTQKTNSYYANILLEHFGNKKIKDITILECQRFINRLVDRYSVIFLSKLKIHGGLILDYAIKMGLIQQNSFKYIQLPRVTVDINAKDTDYYYTKQELKQFLNYVKDTENVELYAIFRTLAFTGIRKGELLALTWEDIDFKALTITINKTLARVDKGTEIQTAKSKSSNRTITIDKNTASILKAWQISQREVLFGYGIRVKKKGQLVFSDCRNNNYLRLSYPNEKIKKICKNNNFKEIKIHGFRHTHCSLLFEAGLTLQEVQYRLGHSDISITMKVYAHVTERQKEKVAEKFQKYVNF